MFIGNSSTSTKIRDLLNPHGRPMRVVEREAVNQVTIDGLTEVVLKQGMADAAIENVIHNATLSITPLHDILTMQPSVIQ